MYSAISLISGSYSLGPAGGGAEEFNADIVEKREVCVFSRVDRGRFRDAEYEERSVDAGAEVRRWAEKERGDLEVNRLNAEPVADMILDQLKDMKRNLNSQKTSMSRQ
jgi:hypothetical protein